MVDCRKDHAHASLYKTPRPQPADPFKPAANLEDPRLAWSVLAACDLTPASRLPQNSLKISVHRSFWSILSSSPSLVSQRGALHVAPRTDLAPLARSDRLLTGDTSSILILISPKGWRHLQGSTGGASSPHYDSN